MDNKGISIQFNWIFVLIAGAVLFAFFIGITLHQGAEAKKERQFSSLNALEASLTNVEQSVTNTKESFRTFKVVETELEVYCDEVNEIRVKDSDFSFPLTTSVVFSQKYLKPGKFDVWVSNWEVPYKVMPFMFVDDQTTQYLFPMEETNLQGQLELLYESISEEFSKKIIQNHNDPLDSGYENYVFVYLDWVPNYDIDTRSNFRAVNIKPAQDNTFEGGGIIDFYVKGEHNRLTLSETKPFLKRESVFGAIFAENADQYECNMEKALKRLSWLTDFHIAKAESLRIDADSLDSCNEIYYENPIIYLNKINRTGFSENEFNEAQEDAIVLDQLNKDLTKKSCPVIY